MATLKGSSKQQTVSVSKFLGLYEAEDGDTQMKRGVSPSMNNYEVTENFHLRTRPGFAPYKRIYTSDSPDGKLLPCKGIFRDGETLYTVFGADVYMNRAGESVLNKIGTLPYEGDTPPDVTIFRFGDSVYFLNGYSYYNVARRVGQPKLSPVVPYVPIVVTGASPSGGGTELERVNMLTSERRALFSADGTSKEYLLPEYNIPANPFVTVEINGVDVPPANYTVSDVEGSVPKQTKVVFQEAPAKGVNNVEISWKAASDSKSLISAMRFVEKFNGATDSRVFFYGDGSNRVFYTEPTLSGKLTGAYIPAMNEIAIGDDTSPVTGLMRHYGRMMAFKPDGT